MSARCPVCSSADLAEGERVDVGFGAHMGVKVGPDFCGRCGYVEQGPDPSDKPIEFYRQRWLSCKLPEPPKVGFARPLPEKYREWVDAHVKDTYGTCRETCRDMVGAFPELKRVYGHYYCFVWGERTHFWCVDPEGAIVDPTSSQFPSRGVCGYVMDREYPLHYDDTVLEERRVDW